MKEFICICCPQGCHLKVDDENGYTVTGNTCKRGEEYGKNEAIAPVRVVTSTVWISGAEIDKCPVKTDSPVPKEKIKDVIAAIKDIKLNAPVKIGQCILENVCGTQANIVVTKDMGLK